MHHARSNSLICGCENTQNQSTSNSCAHCYPMRAGKLTIINTVIRSEYSLTRTEAMSAVQRKKVDSKSFKIQERKM